MGGIGNANPQFAGTQFANVNFYLRKETQSKNDSSSNWIPKSTFWWDRELLSALTTRKPTRCNNIFTTVRMDNDALNLALAAAVAVGLALGHVAQAKTPPPPPPLVQALRRRLTGNN